MAVEASLSNLLFVDIETVSAEPAYEQLSELMKKEWNRKAEHIRRHDDESYADLYFDRAGIYAEFGKVIVISVGIFNTLENGDTELRIKCISGDDELSLLQNFKETVLKFDQARLRMCAHNGKEFDFPYLCRRMLIHGVTLPPAMEMSGKKSWEIRHVDTMELWKFGDYKSFTPLELLAALFEVEAVKQEAIDGSQVNQTYHVEQALDKIASYCKRNVSMLAQVFLRLQSLEPIRQENITMV